ncbi:cutinase family protein [Pseudonocardia humida]|uniref:Cutinase family protein n=1 Tax=Pseudonocardia humida TaxID=2800819 RepID=A0ABT1A802_9PSEU|nr:cutinase family protein [Pseudonocardia humida]MCO1659162.1 cutinase family protein [Pseudonocardia humida]
MKRSPHPRRRLATLLTGAAVAIGAGTLAVVVVPAPAAAPAPTVVAAPQLVADAPADGCAEVETIAVRGTTERQGGGIVAGPLASALQDQLDQTVRTHDLVYPASFAYQSSKRQGVTALRARLQQTSAACPDTRFVLIGYSQGADVIGDALSSGTVPAADRIGAIAMFGDPAFNSREPFVTGSFRAGTNGVLPRATGAFGRFTDSVVSFCNRDDNVCQRGATGTGHFRYGADRQEAVEAVAELLG